jgi:hypothetical protein
VPEVPQARKHHGQIGFISRRNHFIIAYGATGLDHGRRAGLHGLL